MEIRGQVVDLNSPVMKKATEEIRSGNCESEQDKRVKRNNFLGFFARRNIPYGSTPMNFLAWLQQTLFNQPMKVEIITLTWFPSISLRGFHGITLLPFRLACCFLWRHLCGFHGCLLTSLLGSKALRSFSPGSST